MEKYDESDLPLKRERFCQEYIKDYNGTKAAIRVGYSEHSASSAASRLLSFDKIKARIAELEQEALAAAGVTPNSIISELRNIAFGDMSDLVDWDKDGPKLKDGRTLPRSVRATVSEVSKSREGVKIKTHSKEKALELLSRISGMLKDNLNLGSNPDNPLTVTHKLEFFDPPQNAETEQPETEEKKT